MKSYKSEFAFCGNNIIVLTATIFKEALLCI
jgi:hypothetical protein